MEENSYLSREIYTRDAHTRTGGGSGFLCQPFPLPRLLRPPHCRACAPCCASFLQPRKTRTKKETATVIIEFFYECTPPTATAQQRRHNRSGASYLPPAAKRARATWKAILERYRPADVPLGGPIAVELVFTWPWRDADKSRTVTLKHDSKPDLDNIAKLVLDVAGECGYWLDDSQIWHLDLYKYRNDMPGLYFRAEEAR